MALAVVDQVIVERLHILLCQLIFSELVQALRMTFSCDDYGAILLLWLL